MKQHLKAIDRILHEQIGINDGVISHIERSIIKVRNLENSQTMLYMIVLCESMLLAIFIGVVLLK